MIHKGNHGEDVKEYRFYPDNTPMHSYVNKPSDRNLRSRFSWQAFYPDMAVCGK